MARELLRLHGLAGYSIRKNEKKNLYFIFLLYNLSESILKWKKHTYHSTRSYGNKFLFTIYWSLQTLETFFTDD